MKKPTCQHCDHFSNAPLHFPRCMLARPYIREDTAACHLYQLGVDVLYSDPQPVRQYQGEERRQSCR